MRPLVCAVLAIATPARADGLLTDTMLHPMDGFTAYTLKQVMSGPFAASQVFMSAVFVILCHLPIFVSRVFQFSHRLHG